MHREDFKENTLFTNSSKTDSIPTFVLALVSIYNVPYRVETLRESNTFSFAKFSPSLVNTTRLS